MRTGQSRLLLDENMPASLVGQLSAWGHDCIHVRSVDPGAADLAVMAHAARLSRILVTLDRGLPAQAQPPFPPAILVCDVPGLQDLPAVLNDLPQREDGALFVWRNGVLRQLPLSSLVGRQGQ